MRRSPLVVLITLALGVRLASFRWAFVGSFAKANREPRCAVGALTKEEQLLVEEWEKQNEVLTAKASAEKIKGKFPIKPEDLILKAKLYLAKNTNGIKDESLLADDMEFVGPIIGPLDKKEFIKQLGQFDLETAFPDQKVRWHDFRVDPYEPSRVWFTARSMGTNLGPLPPLVPEPTNKAFESPPEAVSIRFNEQGQVVEFTAGYVMDRRQGNTGGLGGLLGPFYAIGKPLPFPEAQPYEWSWQRKLVTFLSELFPPQ
ncbi:unnamed protein product [Effrenium voratum]|nr:unnamed protein product [Effrenium voratum]